MRERELVLILDDVHQSPIGKGKSPIKLGTPFRFVHIWEKRNGTWLLIVDQVTAVR